MVYNLLNSSNSYKACIKLQDLQIKVFPMTIEILVMK